jgi:hypothetical protein
MAVLFYVIRLDAGNRPYSQAGAADDAASDG